MRIHHSIIIGGRRFNILKLLNEEMSKTQVWNWNTNKTPKYERIDMHLV